MTSPDYGNSLCRTSRCIPSRSRPLVVEEKGFFEAATEAIVWNPKVRLVLVFSLTKSLLEARWGAGSLGRFARVSSCYNWRTRYPLPAGWVPKVFS